MADAPHPLLRALAGAGAVGVGVLYLGAEPWSYARIGCAATASAFVVATLPLFVFLALLAIAPGALRRPLARWTAVDLRDPAHVAAAIILAGTLFVVLGQGSLVGAAATIESGHGTCTLSQGPPSSGDAIVQEVLVNLAILTLPVLLYVGIVHAKGPAAMLRAVYLREEGLARATAIGLLAAVVFLAALWIAEAALAPVVPAQYLQNPRAEDIAASVSVPGAIVLAVGSAVGEEIFFRGFLQSRLGFWATAVVFTIAHASYGSVSELVVVGLLALLLGGLLQRTQNLAAPIATHFLFNLLNLLAGSLK